MTTKEKIEELLCLELSYVEEHETFLKDCAYSEEVKADIERQLEKSGYKIEAFEEALECFN